LSPYDYEHHVLPYSRRALEIAGRAGVPVIHFGTNTGGMLGLMREAGGDVIGVDWRIELSRAWDELGDGVAVQGNLDPVALFAEWDDIGRAAHPHRRTARHVQLGHGIRRIRP
jgi:uroporphyrinogen decarboxylase